MFYHLQLLSPAQNLDKSMQQSRMGRLLQVAFGKAAQPLKLMALDGVPLRKNLKLRTIELSAGAGQS
jgi:hypothetical protein